jgi:hypothetical protein
VKIPARFFKTRQVFYQANLVESTINIKTAPLLSEPHLKNTAAFYNRYIYSLISFGCSMLSFLSSALNIINA